MCYPISWFIVFWLLLSSLAPAADNQLPGRVLRIVDGDSLVLDVQGSQYRIELWGIDAPERNQPWGEAAADQLNRTLTGSFVNVRISKKGGRIALRGRDVALDLLYDGLAWSVIPESQSPDQAEHPYNLAQRQASAARRGLWSDEHPVPPWEWRNRRPGLPQ
ncbi:MAG: thermonuclease family protein [Sedimenticolaceae bacterium]